MVIGKLIEKWIKLLKEHECLKQHPFIASYCNIGRHSIVEFNGNLRCTYNGVPNLIVEFNLADKKVIYVQNSGLVFLTLNSEDKKALLEKELPAIIDILQRDIKMLEKITKFLDSEDTSSEDRLSAVEQNVECLLETVDELKLDIKDVEESVSYLRTDLNDLMDENFDLSQLRTEVDNLSSDVNALESEVADLNSRLD